MKKLFAIILGITFILSACGGEELGKTDEQVQDEQETNSLTEQDDLLTNIQETGELKIGTEGTYPPFTFHDESGELTGFDVEIAREVAARLNVEPYF
jgi:cystine transport system substrate-binding protein